MAKLASIKTQDTPNAPRRLVIVVRADPVICGHSTEARNLAEAAMMSGFTEVRILTWPIEALKASGLPLKPIESTLPYSPGIYVERPEPVGDYKIVDGRYGAGIRGRLVELLIDGMQTVVMSMYLVPHTSLVADAVQIAKSTGLEVNVTTIAEAVGSDITNVVRGCVDEGRYGPAVALFSQYLSQDVCAAVSDFTREMIVESAEKVDEACGTTFAEQCRKRVIISYPAIDTRSYVEFSGEETLHRLSRRGLKNDGYILFLSRIAPAKGVKELVFAYQQSELHGKIPLVIAGNGPAKEWVAEQAEKDENILLFCDVDDEEKKALMRGCSAYVLPSKPRPEFVETFGIALTEKMLVGGAGPVVTTRTGGIPEAVGTAAHFIEAENVDSLRVGLEKAILDMTPRDKMELSQLALDHALRFDRNLVFARLMGHLPSADPEPELSATGT